MDGFEVLLTLRNHRRSSLITRTHRRYIDVRLVEGGLRPGGSGCLHLGWLQLDHQLGGDPDVEDAAPHGVRAGHDLVGPPVDEVPDAVAEPAGRDQVAARSGSTTSPASASAPNPSIPSAWTWNGSGRRSCPLRAPKTTRSWRSGSSARTSRRLPAGQVHGLGPLSR
jgi:hypothetical protein